MNGDLKVDDGLKVDDEARTSTVYGGIGWGVFFICLGMSYLVPSMFPDGSMFVIAGSLMMIVNIIKAIKNIGWDGLELIFGLVFFLKGLNSILDWNIGFFPALIILVAALYLFVNINKLRKGHVFN